MLTRLERRQLSRVDDELAALRSDPTLADSARRVYDDLTSNYRAMKELYLHPILPAVAYASRAADLKGRHLRLVDALRADLGFQVPREQMAILESGPEGDPQPDSLGRIMPGTRPPRPGPFFVEPPPFPRGPVFAPGMMGTFDPAQDARERARAMQRRLEDLQERMQSMRPRHLP
jgi:hypothetical protein